jgi:MFS family permease
MISMKTAAVPNSTPNASRLPNVGKDRSKRLSLLVWEGAHANVFIVMTGGAFLAGLAILLGANDFELGLLAAIPFALQSAQLLSPYFFGKPERSRTNIARTLALSRLLWLAVIPLPFFQGAWRLYVLIGIEAISSLLTMVSSPAWLSWMADVVPRRLRGRFFSRRNAAVAAATVIGTICGSLILDWSRLHDNEAIGFVAILLLGALGALMAWRAMNRIPDMSREVEATKSQKVDLLMPIRDKGFRKVLVVFAVWNVAIGLSAAFFAPHMLLNLKMSFFQIGLYSCATAMIAVVSSRIWGGVIDRFGSKPVLKICVFGISLIPLIWLFVQRDSIWILIPEAAYSGLLWAGFNLAAFTLPLDRSPKEHRTVYLSVFATVTGLAFFVASLGAGYSAEILSEWTYVLYGNPLNNYHLLFIGSALVRLATAGLMSAFHEPAETRLPVIIQFMGYAVLKRMSAGRQLFPFVAEASTPDEKNGD